MIGNALTQLATHLNRHLKQSFQLDEDIGLVSCLSDPDGNAVGRANNKILLMVVGLEKENASASRPSLPDRGFAGATLHASPLYLNINMLLTANFTGSNYSDALTLLSASIGFFQRHPVFSRQDLPELDASIERLTLEMENLSLQDTSHLWGMLNGHYQPSVLYKVRMICFNGRDISGRVHLTRSPQTDVGSRG
ncbi:DUF4255 domain-containing protein [Aliiglaciecola sp. CAU 1673]|uniref:DUF4255 domain-containing protein n=1 Tax=Aliiglaciecola sp. CAU 1673 TaxID=3032595 RepID=UPI0023DB5B4C|nr:DUF4255 domain-containing protein [Aliiglaciecola sp. CAU 1673]MDF2177197.1 DUF4255 domain-containing protein [Aliiglaciecola sp. CAU 1673]